MNPDLAADRLRLLPAEVVQSQASLDVPQVEFHMPAKTKQLGDLLPRITLRISQRGDDDQLSHTEALYVHADFQLAYRERLGNRGVGFLVHPLWPRRPLPEDHVIGLAQTLPAAEVGPPSLVLTRHYVHAPAQEQRQHEVRRVSTVTQEHIAVLETVHQLAQQGCLAGLLALVPPDRQPAQGARGQGD